ncbi:MAG: hypothetical protein WC866_03710 [Patescibacteria group bacterium]|jgi:hypothetical protein
MSNDRVSWLFFSPDDLPSPPGAFVYIEAADGEHRLHACYARAEVRALVGRAEGTSQDMRTTSHDLLESCLLPETSDLEGSVMRGWTAAYIMEQFVGEDRAIAEEDLDTFCDCVSGYNFVVPEEGSGTEALLSEFDETGNRVWVLPSRAAARHKLASVRGHASDGLNEACLADLETSPLLEEDGEREMVCISGGLGGILVAIIFCHQERLERMSGDDA